METSITAESKPARCKAPSEELRTNKACYDVFVEDVPPYYHKRAVEICDLFKGEEYKSLKQPPNLIETVNFLCKLKDLQKDSNEYKCTSHLQVILDRVFFNERYMFWTIPCV